MSDIRIQIKDNYSIGYFSAMACPCEVLLESEDPSLIKQLTELAWQEAKRIEHKFSRYREDNIIYKINNSNGEAIDVDEETALMLDFSQQCYELSNGQFDVTSGVLRKIWKFDGSDNIPTPQQVDQIKQHIGWDKVSWKRADEEKANRNNRTISLPENMEIDLGGIGKEYAVDSTAKIFKQLTDCSFLINFGGDIACPSPKKDKQAWIIGIDDPENTGKKSAGKVSLYRGGMATSGDARRFLIKDGIRYSHILDPHTGYPVPDAPSSVTVIADTCIEAGMLSTFAMLQGKQAVEFLKAQGVKYWCID